MPGFGQLNLRGNDGNEAGVYVRCCCGRGTEIELSFPFSVLSTIHGRIFVHKMNKLTPSDINYHRKDEESTSLSSSCSNRYFVCCT